MARSMVHPYLGHLIVCAELDGTNHQHFQSGFDVQFEMCDRCGSELRTCVPCGVYIECCPCGAHHAVECPWPL
jgi:hypothetical protein